MKIAYFDCFSGASGDMILGSLLDAGLSVDRLMEELLKLRLSHFEVRVEKVSKKGIGGSQAIVDIDDHHHNRHHRHLEDIEEIIGTSSLDESVKQKSLEIFRRLAEAEAKVHRTSVDHIHFHEVGAMDAIIDVVGGVAGLAAMGIERVYCSPLHVGSGTVECAHGILPVPAPATAELIKGKPFYSTGVLGELLTPTGAAILTTLSSGFGPFPAMTMEQIGYGAGTSEPDIPNLLRVFIGEAGEDLLGYEKEQIVVIETNIDDMNPQLYDYLISGALDLGALDVYLTPVQMKKNRPGTLVTVTCLPQLMHRLSEFILRETTTIGLRWRLESRIKARRSIREILTQYGPIQGKVAESDNGIINISPEYDDCKRIAREKNVPLKEVMDAARVAALSLS
ncbi:MAG: nickel pincer cofactor biosynthesis protein LarC [Syntrophobacteraceae bacterium]|nr:nickel pincer cofactor biosynthesis protein LarC [Syntrophobacteraceae bacterium]